MTQEDFEREVAARGFTRCDEDFELIWRHPSGVTFSDEGIRDMAAMLGIGVYDETLTSLDRRVKEA